VKYRRIVWWEWAISVAIAFATAAVIHVVSIYGLTKDMETWNGSVVSAVHCPEWVETWEEAVYRTEFYTDSDGNTHTRQVFSHYETRYRTHSEYWEATAYFGKKTKHFDISKKLFSEMSSNWKSSPKAIPGVRKGYYSGDKNDYVIKASDDYIYPATINVNFENKVRACPSIFSYVQPPEGTHVYNYPSNSNWRVSNRLLGSAKKSISILEWDRMNSRLGPTKKVT